jgi:antitoxin ParD1/3/4
MPMRNVNLTPELDAFVVARVESGRYADASEVVRNGLRLLEEREMDDEAKLAALRQAIDEADASEDAEEDLFDRLDAYIDKIGAEEQCLPTA